MYLSTKNGTFPITLTTKTTRDISTTESALKVVASRNITYGDENPILKGRDMWQDVLLSSDINATVDDLSRRNLWKRSINDAVSKNITMVLENLLKNYENSQLPTHGKGYIIALYLFLYLIKSVLILL